MIQTKKIPAIYRLKNRYKTEVIKAVENYLSICRNNNSAVFWPIRMFSALNLFLWHLEAFKKNKDPSEDFANVFNRHSLLIKNAKENNVVLDVAKLNNNEVTFEENVSDLFSNIWVEMHDDIYFDETFYFTSTRFKKNNIDPESFFKNKVVLDAGCGSGKFSATIAKFGAKKVYGVDIGKKGLDFARQQAKKKKYCSKVEYIESSLLNIPLDDSKVDIIWSNGVIHHTIDYKKCLQEFNRVLKKKGKLFLYVNGSFGLFELLQDSLRICNEDIPQKLFQNYIKSLGVNSGRLYWLMDCLYAPYEYKSLDQIKLWLNETGFNNFIQLKRGVPSDQIEQISQGLPYNKEKYDEGQVKIISTKK